MRGSVSIGRKAADASIAGIPALPTSVPDLPIDIAPLPYEHRLATRPLAHTELPDLATAREYGERVHYEATRTGNSGHFYIDRDGSVHRWVAIDRVAHHTRGCNPRSIGIELVNTGRYPHWLAAAHQAMDEPYPDAQVASLVALLHELAEAVPTLRHIAGHEDLDTTEVAASDDPTRRVRRKRDPGPLFPWEHLLQRITLARL
jgi:N-acetylmuramoyl-L-alanine amidase